MPSRDEAWTLLCEFTKSEGALRHARAVEAVMAHMARARGEDEHKWGVVGLLHDLDYERFPNEHCAKARQILEERGWPDEIARAVASHGWGICSELEPQTEMEKMLYAVDELTGLVAASALVRPSRSVLDLTAASVQKKWKDKHFAAGVDRQVIRKGAEMLGIDLAELITQVILAMREVADEIGLAGVVRPDAHD